MGFFLFIIILLVLSGASDVITSNDPLFYHSNLTHRVIKKGKRHLPQIRKTCFYIQWWGNFYITLEDPYDDEGYDTEYETISFDSFEKAETYCLNKINAFKSSQQV